MDRSDYTVTLPDGRYQKTLDLIGRDPLRSIILGDSRTDVTAREYFSDFLEGLYCGADNHNSDWMPDYPLVEEIKIDEKDIDSKLTSESFRPQLVTAKKVQLIFIKGPPRPVFFNPVAHPVAPLDHVTRFFRSFWPK